MTLDLNEIRQEIDEVDSMIVKLYEKRMDIVKKVAQFKIENNKPVLDGVREKAKLDSIEAMASTEQYAEDLKRLYELIFEMSRDAQTKMIEEYKNNN